MTFYQVNEIFDSIQGEGMFTGIPSTFIRLQGCTVGCEWCDSGPLADLPTKEHLESILADIESQPDSSFEYFIEHESDVYGKMTVDQVRNSQIERVELEIRQHRIRSSNGLTENTWTKGGIKYAVGDIIALAAMRHVVVTGGEPTIYNLDRLFVGLQAKGKFVQLETSGQNKLKGLFLPDWLTWSPKERLDYDAPYQIKGQCHEVKWVVDKNLTQNTDVIFNLFEWMLKERIENIPFFVLMPEGCPPSQENIGAALFILDKVNSWALPYFRFGDRLQYRIGVR